MKRHNYAGVFIMFVIWFAFSITINNDILIPYPKEVFITMFEQLRSNYFYIAIFGTILRLLKGIILSLIFATFIALFTTRYKVLDNIFKPIELFLKSIPTVSYIIISIIWLGQNNSADLVVFLVVFPILYQNITYGLTLHDEELKEVLLIYPEKYSVVLRKILVPELLPQLAIGFRSSIALGFKVCVMAELLAYSSTGIGRYLYIARLNLDMTSLIAWSVWVIIIASLFDDIFVRIIKLIEDKS